MMASRAGGAWVKDGWLSIEPLHQHPKSLRCPSPSHPNHISPPLGEGLLSGDLPPHDERQDGIGAVVGIDGLHVGQVPGDVVLE